MPTLVLRLRAEPKLMKLRQPMPLHLLHQKRRILRPLPPLRPLLPHMLHLIRYILRKFRPLHPIITMNIQVSVQFYTPVDYFYAFVGLVRNELVEEFNEFD